MKKFLLSTALVAAMSFAASAQCDWRDFKGVKLYVEAFGDADVDADPVEFKGRPERCDKDMYFYYDGHEKLYWDRDGREDTYYVEYDHRRDDYTTLDVTDNSDANKEISFFQIVQCEKDHIIVWTSDGIANICRPSGDVDYEYKEYDHRPPHHDDWDGPHHDDDEEEDD